MKPNVYKNTRPTPRDVVSISDAVLNSSNKMAVFGLSQPFTFDSNGCTMNPDIAGGWETNYTYIPSIYCNAKKVTVEFDYEVMSTSCRFEAGFIKPTPSNSVNQLLLEITSLDGRVLVYFKTLDAYYPILACNATIGQTVKFRMVFNNDTFYAELFINNKWVRSTTIGVILPTCLIGFIPVFGQSRVKNLRAYTNYSYETEVRFIGDSNTANATGLGRMAVKYWNSVGIYAAQGDTSLEVANSVIFINTISRSKTTFVMIGTNDIPLSIPYTTFVRNIENTYRTLRGNVVFLEIPPRNGIYKDPVALYNRELRRVIPDNKLVPIYSMLKDGTGGLAAAYDSGDGIHLNSVGVDYILRTLKNWL